MADTTFSSGTTIASTWLNDVNDRVYNDIVNVKNPPFNATGNGSTDDTAAIQAAVDSVTSSSGGTTGSGGYTIWFPPGVYKISSAIQIGQPSNGKRLILEGGGMIGATGATLKNTSNSNVDIIDASTIVIDTFSMYGLVLWGNGKGTGTGCGVKLGDNSSATKCLFDSQISRCWFTQIPDACIAGENIADYQIFENGIENSAVGIRLKNPTITGGSGNQIRGNTIFGCGIGVHLITGSAGGGEDTRIEDNVIWFCGTDPGGTGDDTHAGIILDMTGSPAIRDTLIATNTFRACVNDILLLGHNGSYTGNTGVNAISIIGNHSDRGFRRFLQIDGANYIRVVGNTIDSCGQETTNTYDAIEVKGTSDNCYFTSNSVSTSSGVFNKYGLSLGSSTVNTILGTNVFAGGTGDVSINASATLSNASTYVQQGTWTPAIGGNATYTLQEGYYRKQGKLVFIKGKIIINVLGTGSTSTVSGLPFTSDTTANSTPASGSVAYFASLATNVTFINPVVVENSTTMTFTTIGAAGATASNATAVFGNATRIDFSVTYLAAQ